MFSELSKLIGKNFAIGYFVPVVVFLSVLLPTIQLLGDFELPYQKVGQDLALLTSLVALAIWLVAIVLVGFNKLIYRALEGYGVLNPLQFFHFIEKTQFGKLKAEFEVLYAKVVNSEGGRNSERDRSRLARLGQRLSQRYPDDERWLLPTSFGNTIRAFEVYPRVMYGIEGIQGWIRLIAVIPKDYAELLENSKAQADFWVNLFFLTFIYIVYSLAAMIWTSNYSFLWGPAIASVISIVFYSLARSCVQEWGELVKAAFDVFLNDLEKKLGFSSKFSLRGKMTKWQEISQGMSYRKPF